MKHFLRFQISGMTFFLWLAIFFVFSSENNSTDKNKIQLKQNILESIQGIKSINIDINNTSLTSILQAYKDNNTTAMSQLDFKKIISISNTNYISDVLIGFLPFMVFFALPIGVIIHQISNYFYLITTLSKTQSLCIHVLIFSFYIMLLSIPIAISISLWHYLIYIFLFILTTVLLLIFAKDNQDKNNNNKLTVMSINNNFDSILKKSSNLKTYFYTRFDNGVLAPLFAYMLISYSYQIEINIICLSVFISLLMVAYIPILSIEIHKIEDFIKDHLNNKQTNK